MGEGENMVEATESPVSSPGHLTCTSAFFLEDGWWAECLHPGCDWQSPTFARHDLAVNAAHDHTATTRALTQPTLSAPPASPSSEVSDG